MGCPHLPLSSLVQTPAAIGRDACRADVNRRAIHNCNLLELPGLAERSRTVVFM
jgi:hypothetical protein